MSKEIEVKIGERPYKLAVEDSQETRVRSVAAMLDESVSKMRMASGSNIDRDRLLVLAGIMMADNFLTQKENWKNKEQTMDKFQNSMADKIESLVESCKS